MIRLVAVTLIALVMMGGLAMPAQADTISTSGTVTGNSTLTPTGIPGVFGSNFIGSGVDSVSGAFKATNTSITIFSSSTAFTSSGTFIDVFAGGTVFGTFNENGTVTGATISTITIDTVTTGGTGIFAGDTGESTVMGTNTTTSSPMFTGTYTGFINTVPEPSSLALLVAGIGVLLVMRKRIGQGLPRAN